ncbi:DUF943 family protein [Enterobacteriaceae bacterium LUAb1]
MALFSLYFAENITLIFAVGSILCAPKPASYGVFTNKFHDSGEGDKEKGQYNRPGFHDMKTMEIIILSAPFITALT